jgi:ribulose 1,5-bisphosphate carboxylase large subunit-like protein
MKPTMTENKKSILMEHLRSLESEINNIYHLIEEDESISNEQYKVYETRIEKLFSIFNQIEEEILFS